jgi:uncharacterized membrane protein
MTKKTTSTLLSIIALVALSRLLPHPPNFAPLGAIAVFSSVTFRSKFLKYALPVLLAIVTDFILVLTVNSAFTSPSAYFGSYGTYVIYLTYFIIGVGAHFLNKGHIHKQPKRIFGLSLASSTFFFLVSNFVVWLGGAYTYSIAGLGATYVAAIPFFHNSIGGDLFFNSVLFGSYYLLTKSSFAEKTING